MPDPFVATFPLLLREKDLLCLGVRIVESSETGYEGGTIFVASTSLEIMAIRAIVEGLGFACDVVTDSEYEGEDGDLQTHTTYPYARKP